MLLANNGVRSVSRILTEFVEEHSDNPTFSSSASARLKILSNGYGKNESPGCDSNSDPRCNWQEKAPEYLSKNLSKHPAAAIAAYATLLAIHEDKEWRKALVKLITITPELVCDVIPWVNAKAAGILSECRPSVSR